MAPAGEQTLDDARDLHRAGRLEEALEAYREVAVSSRTSDPAGAGTAHNNACVILMNTGDHRVALEECRAALALRRQVGDPRRTARSLNNLGLTLQYVGQYDESEVRFEEAMELNRTLGDLAGQVVNQANLGVMATEAGWYAKALEYHERALQLARAHPDEPWSAEQAVIARINQGVVLERLGAYEEALSLYRGLEDAGESLSPRQRASLSTNIGVVYRNLGDPVRALEAYEAAAATYTELGDTGRLANAYLNMALVRHRNLEDPTAAEPIYREALGLAERSGDRAEEIKSLYYLGHLLLDLERVEEAEDLFRLCLAEAEESGSSEGRWSALEGLGRTARARGDLDASLARFDEAIREIEAVRSSLRPGGLRSDYFGDKRPVYESAVEVLARMGASDPEGPHARRAFELVQRAKVRALLDALGPGAAPGEPLDAAAVMERLGSDALVEYFLARRGAYAWIVSEGHLTMRSLGPTGPLIERAAEMSAGLANGNEPSPELSRAVSESVLGPVEPLLGGARHLRIASDGVLRYLPFEVLQVPGKTGKLLIEERILSYLPSASSLGIAERPRRPPHDLGLVGFGDPRIGGRAEGDSMPAYMLASRFELGPLPEAAAELSAIRERLSGTAELRTGVNATESEFVRLATQGPTVVHVASHTVVDERRGRGTAILLAPDDEADGLLFPEEIAVLEYPVELTVLAACRTAIEPGHDGRALTSLTGAFLAAGSSAVLATLWDVGDVASGVFVRQFYYQLSRGHEPAVALQRVKRKMLSDPQWRHPSLWSGYVLIGEAPALAASHQRIAPALAVLLVLVIVAGLAALGLRHRTRKDGSRSFGAPAETHTPRDGPGGNPCG